MTDFLAAEDRALLERHGLGTFDALWDKQLDAVDEPNTDGGGWSSVFRLELEGHGYYLKRQSNYLTRTLHAPFGEPTFAREFRNISRYNQLGIPALQAAFFGQRKVNGEVRAILLTRALDGWDDLDSLLQRWSSLEVTQHSAILKACGQLARRLHGVRQVHGCFYPKHIFLRAEGTGYQAQLIDLEKTRPLLFGQRDRVKDLEPLLRRAPEWNEAQLRELLAAYLDQSVDSSLVDSWVTRLTARRSRKETR
ncbi:lipopolysaccharide kinase [Pseudomonas sp. FW215-R2]|uniref:lipopolysaccharide kinase InaA family protein n=1 Tax=unclassified Pseudomonas TaxID=196821 RepID=UPI000C8821D4|nr:MULTISPECIES: lipopolysaccharide kinase InaA family protein [unclassified Pseudomonas]PMX02739.1 lipopolysaccharide kinase [Pseudomonas sp. FW215-R2]PMX11554.1 lipopolysaccharide kinase [Pseudomonas sp. FW215-L1]PMX23665.1 lipopolysaccharide kinase [Pseudomonas sp. FW215-E1]PNA32100.1 lipopolysaccharide kinase [Pseudomonas sp. FW215-R4]